MKNYPRHRANAQRYIMKQSYESIIRYAKQRFTDEFYVFFTMGWYSVESSNTDGTAIEHWKKNGRWEIKLDLKF